MEETKVQRMEENESEENAFFSSLDQFGQKIVDTDTLDEAGLKAIISLTKAYNSKDGPEWFD